MTQRRATVSPGAPRRLFLALAVTTTLGFGLLLYAISVMIPPMMADLGWSNAALSAGPTLGLAVSGLCAPIVGRTIDRRGGRGIMVAGTLVGGAGVLLWSMTTFYAGYLGAWTVIGVGMAMSLYEPAFATIVRHAPGRRRTGILAVTLVGALASTIFIPLAALLVDLVGWRLALVLLAAGHVAIAAPCCLLWLPRGREVIAAEPEAEPQTEEPADPVTSVGPGTDLPLPTDRPQPAAITVAPTLAGSSRLRRIVIATVLGGSATVAVGVHLVASLVATGRTPSSAALIAGLLGIAKVGGRLGIGAAAKHRGSRPLLVLCLAAMGASLSLPLISPSRAADVVMVVAFGAASGGMTVLQPLFVFDQFGPQVFGLTAGRITRLGQLSFALSPLVVGGIVTLSGSYAPAWAYLAAGCVLGALVLPPSRTVGGHQR